MAVRADLVAARPGLADEVREALGDPAEEEQRRGDAVLAQQVEQAVEVALDPRRQRRPAVRRRPLVEVEDMEPVLDVDREDVGRGAGKETRSNPTAVLQVDRRTLRRAVGPALKGRGRQDMRNASQSGSFLRAVGRDPHRRG
jgi:hypothetical protein